MNRREFTGGLAGAAAWPAAANAQQQPSKIGPAIGFLGASTRAAWNDWATAFVSRLQDLDWTEGRNVTIEYRWGDGRIERFVEIAAEFVRLKVDVIVTGGSAVPTAKAATSVIPIVFAIAGDPVAGGLVASLARPGGNVTGLSIQRTDLAPKELELFREIVPSFRRLAVLANAGYREAVIEMHEASAAAQKQGVEVKTLQVLKAAEIGPALDTVRGWCDALYVCTDPLLNANRVRISTFALAERLPTMHGAREYVEAGGLMSYGPNYPNLFCRAAEFVDKILRGTKPEDIQVEQPTKFDLVINLFTAKTLGIAVPESFLFRADEVIE